MKTTHVNNQTQRQWRRKTSFASARRVSYREQEIKSQITTSHTNTNQISQFSMVILVRIINEMDDKNHIKLAIEIDFLFVVFDRLPT